MEVEGARDSDGCAIYHYFLVEFVAIHKRLNHEKGYCARRTIRFVLRAGGEEKIPSVATATITSTIISISMIPIEY